MSEYDPIYRLKGMAFKAMGNEIEANACFMKNINEEGDFIDKEILDLNSMHIGAFELMTDTNIT